MSIYQPWLSSASMIHDLVMMAIPKFILLLLQQFI